MEKKEFLKKCIERVEKWGTRERWKDPVNLGRCTHQLDGVDYAVVYTFVYWSHIQKYRVDNELKIAFPFHPDWGPGHDTKKAEPFKDEKERKNRQATFWKKIFYANDKKFLTMALKKVLEE